jgi:5-bromo-4-chloroindolyl phosphate hydrolysis protein
MERGTSTLIAGGAAAIALPLCVLVLGLPLWLGALVALGVFAGLHLALRSQGFGLKLDDMSEAQNETARALIDEATLALTRMRVTAHLIKDVPMRELVTSLASTASGILDHIKDAPTRAMAVRRFLTFYLPNAAAVAQGWQTLEGNSNPSPQRMTQTREVMGALKDAFAKFENDADAPELSELDLNLKVIKDSLKADLEKTV